MEDWQDFSLRITVMPPEPAVDEHASTTPFVRQPLPGVSLRPAARMAPPPPPPRAAAPERPAPAGPPPLQGQPPLPNPAASDRPPPPPLRVIRGQALLAAPPAADARPAAARGRQGEEARARRQARARKRSAWARIMLQRFRFDDPT